MNNSCDKNILQSYTPPDFVVSHGLQNIPSQRVKLGNFPTPLQPWSFCWKDKKYNMLIKRDDLSDLTASGNKLRKLEFILPEVINGNHDWILSLGPTQSNCCRVISAIAPRIGLRSAHVLVKTANYNPNRPTEGNLFFHDLFGSKLFLASREEYLKEGQEKLLQEACQSLIDSKMALNPYILQMGGNTVHGTFGYIECIKEIGDQLDQIRTHIDEIFFSCGSGGTAAGLVVGKYLSPSPFLKNTKLTGYIVWDSTPEHFHGHVNEMLSQLGLDSLVKSEDIVEFIIAKGEGYGLNTEEEIDMIRSVARTSGIVLDGTYTVKALSSFIKEGKHEGKTCLFLHTGGLFSMLGKDGSINKEIF